MINDTIVGEVRRVRLQNNFDERLFLEAIRDESSVSLIRVEAPQRSPQKCERYTVGELRAVPLDKADETQLIISETSSISDVRSKIRSYRQRVRELRIAYSADLRRKWSSLLTQQKTVTYYKKTSTMAFRKAKWKKIPTGESRLVVRFVYLKPRKQHVIRKRDGKTVDFGFITVRPRVRRELLVPIYRKVMLRPAGLRRVTIRTKVEKQVTDWDKIRPVFTVYKIERRAQLDADLAPLQSALADCIRIAAARIQQPHRLVACTNTGWIPPSWEEYYYQHFRSQGHYEDVYAHYRLMAYGVHPGWGVTASGPMSVSSPSYATITVGLPVFEDHRDLYGYDADGIRRAMRELETGYKIQSPGSFKARDMLIPKTVVDRMVLLDEAFNAEPLDTQSEALAASTVRSLRNKGDYVFNLPRSIGELKDSKGTFRQAAEFFRWFARGTRTRNALPEMARVTGGEILRRTGKASLAVIGAYLAWKFAIQPTIQDVETLKSHTAEWLLATRRALMESINGLRKTSSNILHIRAKYFGSSAVRSKSLKNVVMGVDARDEYVELVSWAKVAAPTLRVFKGSGNVVSSYSTIENIRWGDCDPAATLSHEGTIEMTGSSDDRRWKYDGSLPGTSYTIDSEGSKTDPLVVTVPDKPFAYDVGVRESVPIFPFDCGTANSEIAEKLSDGAWPRVNCNGYLFNQVSGVLFARYQLGDLLEFLDLDHQNSDLAALLRLTQKSESWADILDRLWREGKFRLSDLLSGDRDRAAAMLSAWDTVYVAWQLAPLSFIYDWVTTSESVVAVINNFLTEYSVPAPPPMEGVWETKRLELLAGRPSLEVDRVEAESYVSDWYGGRLSVGAQCTYRLPDGQHDASASNSFYWAYPKRLTTVHRIWYKSAREVALNRSGLYAAKRGEFIDGGWETFLPQVQIKLNANKVGTMLAILAGFIAPRK